MYCLDLEYLYDGTYNKKKIWDAILLDINIRKNDRIALSAGGNGLFEYDIYDETAYQNKNYFKTIEKNLFFINESQSNYSQWMYSSIYSSSYKGNSYIVGFDWDDKKKLNYTKTVYQYEIFKNNNSEGGFSWGINDRIYKLKRDGLEYVTFTQKGLKYEYNKAFSEVNFIKFQSWKGDLLSASASSFGVIIECENALVIKSEICDDYLNISGPITRWRTFNADDKYYNQLHVIHDDRIQVLSFDISKHHLYF